MEFTPEIESFISEYVKALKADSASIFAGAGLSIPAGAVPWKELLRQPARELQLDVDREHDLVILAQYFYNKHQSRQKLSQLIIDHFHQNGRITDNHHLLARLPINSYWTTNYDRLIENALEQNGKTPDTKRRIEDFSIIRPRRDAIVYKMHGDVDLADKVTLTKDDYETYQENNHLFTLSLKGELVSKTFLFIGFSFEDPNLEYILSRIRGLVDGHTRTHYCFFKKINRSSYPKGKKGTDQYRYDTVKQDLKCADLIRYHIQPILVDDYPDITEILSVIYGQYRRQKVFVSGSAAQYDGFELEDMKPTEFIHKLSHRLNEEGCKIVTGFGNGVGSAVINGVLERIYQTTERKLDNHLLMRPFPQFITHDQSKDELWDKYRRMLIPEAGIAIFIFGNKEVDGKIIDGDGVQKEFAIAEEQGLKVIPIGITGYVSKSLWQEVMTNFEKYYKDYRSLKSEFNKLGNNKLSANEIIETVITIVKRINGGDING
ncbi:hypothetical protein IKS_05927 [Bacillus cereus VDM062]|nr:hypothetical protein IKS_05927 [Bacillus cereus VDM062]